MSTSVYPPALPTVSRPALVLVVGDTATAHLATTSLEPAGVMTLVASSGHDALVHVTDSAPDLVVVGEGRTQDMTGGELVRQLRDRPGKRPPIVVIGRPEDVDIHRDGAAGSGLAGEDYLPADVGLADLITHIRFRLDRPAEAAVRPGRPALSEQRLAEEIERELQRARLARRPGMLAMVSVAEVERLRARLGSQACDVIAATFDELFAVDAPILEQHTALSSGGFLLLMPETGLAEGRDRLLRLSRLLDATVLDVDGEQVRITPVIGFASFAGAGDGPELRAQAATALRDACRHLDLLPVNFTPVLAAAPVPTVGARDRLLSLVERLRSPLQITFTLVLLVSLPFTIYVLFWYAGFDLTRITYPLVAAALAGTAAVLWIENFLAIGAVEPPDGSRGDSPVATAIIAAYLPNEAATIVDTVLNLLGQDYPGELQVILAYNSPHRLPVEEALEELAAHDSRLLLLRVEASTSKAQNVNAALAYVRGEFVGVFDADHHPAQGSFSRAWQWLSTGHDVVQGHCVVRNGEASWVARMVAVEFETIYAVSHPGRARLHGFGIFGGSNGYWRADALRQIRMQGSMLTEDIDSSMRSLRDGLVIVSDPGLISSELAPLTMGALWNQRMRWAQGWTQTSRRHLRPALTSDRLSGRQRLGAAFLLGWTQVVPWVTIQIVPILAFTAWRDGGFGGFTFLVPLFVLLSIFTFSVGIAQAVFGYLLGDESVRRHRAWFVVYGLHTMIWYGELKNLIARVAQLKELVGERQWRVTPRSTVTSGVAAAGGIVDGSA